MFASPAPTLFLTVRENSKHSPRKRKLPTGQQNVERSKVSVHEDYGVQCCIIDPLSAGSMAFSRITREGDVCFYMECNLLLPSNWFLNICNKRQV